MEKNIKTMIVPVASIIALGVGAALGLNHTQVNGVEKFIEYVADAVLIAASWWGVHHNHVKVPVQEVVKTVEKAAVQEAVNVVEGNVQK